jgi:hypothetical protein
MNYAAGDMMVTEKNLVDEIIYLVSGVVIHDGFVLKSQKKSTKVTLNFR